MVHYILANRSWALKPQPVSHLGGEDDSLKLICNQIGGRYPVLRQVFSNQKSTG
jgi:hypothetical protein